MEKLINWFKRRGPFIATIVLLIAVPIYPKFPLKSIGGTYVSIRLVDILVGGGFIVCLISQFLKGLPILKSRIFKLFMIYWLAGLTANLAAVGITDLVSVKLAFFHWLRRIEYMGLFFLTYQSVNKENKDENIADIRLFVGASLLFVFVYGIGQKFWQFPVISTMNEEFSKGILLYLDKWTRINSTFAGHYDLAAWLVMILALLPAGIAKVKKWWKKVFGFLLGLFGLYLLILTASRVSFIAYVIAITASLFFMRKYKWIVPVLMVSFLFGLTSKELNARLRSTLPAMPAVDERIAYVSDLWETESKKVSNKIMNIKIRRRKQKLTPTPEPIAQQPIEESTEEVKTEPEEETKEKIVKEVRTWPTREEAAAAAARSSNIRFEVEWPRAVRAFIKNPLTGTGLSSLGLATDNDYLRLMGESGVIGFGGFMLIILHLLVHFWKHMRSRKENWVYSAGMIGLTAGILANAVFIDIFEASKVAFYFWMLMGIGYKLTKLEISNSKSES